MVLNDVFVLRTCTHSSLYEIRYFIATLKEAINTNAIMLNGWGKHPFLKILLILQIHHYISISVNSSRDNECI